MIRSGESSLAVLALERLDARVLPHVAGQLVRAGKLPAAPLPVALVRFLPSVRALVCLEVGALRVHFVAARVGATMHSLVSLRGLGIVVHGVHEVIRGVGWEGVGQQLRVQWLLLQWRGRVGAWGSDDIGWGGVVLKGDPGTGCSVEIVPRLVGVGLGVHVEVNVDHRCVLGVRWRGEAWELHHASS